ncbi:ATP-binding cassette domain-containing protein [Flavobacterium aquatile]|uniref:ABC transporter ATP-binding protein n=1 Tax=Flavobacterium aquatile LMG 4008 = ATCC 11947 TaxID=1453498 RepID=A0A095TYP2_9FLAO|nr:ABC transporter ATP-binding protein [Flavobacterium aquatile]KGD67493.1 ABC transporter ATP-binding protein [Flavobacterium aquatile LMG 4008 = ATCC 11947]
MSEFEKQYEELLNFLKFEDFSILTKRIIDLTLDTEDINYYKKTNDLLIWLDHNENNVDAKKVKYQEILSDLHQTLISKPILEKKVLVSTSNLQKSYGSSSFGLGPIDMELRQGEILGLVGENGNGKTTLLRCLCGELFATSGKINYHFNFKDDYHLRTKLVYIPQRTETWYGSMFENLQFTATNYGYKPEENELVVELIIARLGLRKFRNHSWKSLSSGYKMRFELARMLLRKPEILLIDEPLANLDILAQQTVLEDFRSIAKSPFRPIGIVLSSQQLYEVEKTSDQVIFLKQGKQKNLHEKASQENEVVVANNLVIEFESSLTQGELGTIFENLNMISLQFNGGTYIVNFPDTVSVYDFMQLAISHKIPLQYFRNISNSTRRFFVS